MRSVEIVLQRISGRRTSQQNLVCSCHNLSWLVVSTNEDIVRVKPEMHEMPPKISLPQTLKPRLLNVCWLGVFHHPRIDQVASKPRRPVAVISRLRPKYSSSVTFVEPCYDVVNTLSCLKKWWGTMVPKSYNSRPLH